MQVKFSNGWNLTLCMVTENDNSLLGFVHDGCFWLDYNKESKSMTLFFNGFHGEKNVLDTLNSIELIECVK